MKNRIQVPGGDPPPAELRAPDGVAVRLAMLPGTMLVQHGRVSRETRLGNIWRFGEPIRFSRPCPAALAAELRGFAIPGEAWLAKWVTASWRRGN